jgi:hypothetical protein
VIEAVAHHHAPQLVRQTGFDVLAALVMARALTGTDDTEAFQGAVPADARAGPDYLEALGAPFSWDEAVRRAGLAVPSGETCRERVIEAASVMRR